jgi:hypothetical protein
MHLLILKVSVTTGCGQQTILFVCLLFACSKCELMWATATNRIPEKVLDLEGFLLKCLDKVN